MTARDSSRTIAYTFLLTLVLCLYLLYSPVLSKLESITDNTKDIESEMAEIRSSIQQQKLTHDRSLEQLGLLNRQGIKVIDDDPSQTLELILAEFKNNVEKHEGRLLQFLTSSTGRDTLLAQHNLDINFILPLDMFPDFVASLNSSIHQGLIGSLSVTKSATGSRQFLNGQIRLMTLRLDNLNLKEPLNLDNWMPVDARDEPDYFELAGLLDSQNRRALRSKSLDHLRLIGISLSERSGSALFRDSFSKQSLSINLNETYLGWSLTNISADSVKFSNRESMDNIEFTLNAP